MGNELERINLKVNHPDPDDDARQRVVWMHHNVDQTWVQWCRDKALVDMVDCFVFVSYWQRERYLKTFALPADRCVVLRNATDVDPSRRLWKPGPVWRCAYTSTPFRGLSVLLDAWERLSPSNAELHIWSSMKLYLGDDGPYNHLYERAQSLPGVIYHGIVPNPELRAALRDMHFHIYPSTFEETSCLAVIEAMAAGCRVIAPALGALPETTHGFGRIYPSIPDENAHAGAFADIFSDELSNPWSGQTELSLEQQRHCTTVYEWGRRIEEWRRLIDRMTSNTGARRPVQSTERPVIAFVSGNGRADVLAAARSLAKGGTFVEVGTWKGEFAERLCTECEPAKLYCVDPYVQYADYRDTINTRDRLDDIHAQALARLERFGGRVDFIRAFSADAVGQFADASLDFVYIDGNHSFRFVLHDLCLWYPKLRDGGLLCADDAVDTDEYRRNEEGDAEIAWASNSDGTVACGGNYGVLKAVREFCAQHSLEFFLSGTQVLIQKVSNK